MEKSISRETSCPGMSQRYHTGTCGRRKHEETCCQSIRQQRHYTGTCTRSSRETCRPGMSQRYRTETCNRRTSRRITRRILCLLLSILLAAPILLPGTSVQAAGNILTLSQAQNLALAKNRKYKKIKSKISMQQVKYAAAVKSIQIKKKNMSTFRWTPLLSFKFPQQPELSDSYEWQYKPLQIQTQISVLSHQLTDTRYEALEKVSNQYVLAYICQEKADFTRERTAGLEKDIARNEIRVKTGEASQADVDKMKNSLKKLENDLSLQMRSLETAKKKLGDLTGMDLTVGYTFSDPLVSAGITRDMLSGLVAYTLENDQAFYETKLNTQLAYIGLTLNESLMRGQYGKKMNMLNSYISQAKKGEELDSDSFKETYDRFLTNIDAPWNGKFRILFIKIPKEWFKGEIDGVRYIQDEPYALYTSALDYQDAKQEQDSMERDLKESVTDSFEALVTARNAYQSLLDTTGELEQELKKSARLNQIGELSYQELSSQQDTYEEMQMECMDALASYSQLLYSFDRLSCGGITKYLAGESLDQTAVSGGNSYLEEELAEGASYYIQSKVEDNLFVFGISIPEDFSISITGYELWVDNTQVGERTDKEKEIRHLTLMLENPGEVTVKLFDGEKLVDEVPIDARVTQGELEISGGYRLVTPKEQKRVASYSCTREEELGISRIRFQPEPGEGISYYQVTDKKGTPLYQKELVPIEEEFSYLSVMTRDVTKLKVIFFDSDQKILYEGIMDELTQSVMTDSGQE